MAKKFYKHLNMPKQLISKEVKYTPSTGGYPPSPENPFNRIRHKKKLVRRVKNIDKFYDDRQGQLFLEDDKGNKEIRMDFIGLKNIKLIEKYGLDIYKVTQDKSDNETIYAKVSNKKLEGQAYSDFERLKKDILIYRESDTDKYKSYFDLVRDIKPLEIKEIVDDDFLEELEAHQSKNYYIDVSFVGDTKTVGKKLDKVLEDYGNNFVLKINRDALRFCRLKGDYKDIKSIVSKFDGITRIEKSPIYILETSELKKSIESIDVISPPNNINPVFVFDTDINSRHRTLNGSVEDSLFNDGSDQEHGTAVASLVVCGTQINPSGVIQQDNKIIAVKVSQDNFRKLESIIEETIERYSSIYPMLIVNLSVNRRHIVYPRTKEVDKLTILLDDLANKHNCLFVVSAGNLFLPDWPVELVNRFHSKGYPNYFNEKSARIIPPADSINNISVGSVVFQESSDSIAKLKSPAIHTRGNFDKFPFIKPDLVNFDSNHKDDFSCEENGVFMAHSENDVLTSIPGTSFAAPLVTHDLALLHNKYPELSSNSIKGLLLHFSDRNIGGGIRSKKIREKLIGFGLPDVEKALYSTNNNSTIIIEDEITVGNKKEGVEKIIRFPIPNCIAGDHRRRLRINKTLVYNPPVNAKNLKYYNPISISVQLVRSDEVDIAGRNTNDVYDGAHQKSNVQKYPPIEKNTVKHTGSFWHLKIICENKDESFISMAYKQSYSVILSLEDIKEEDSIDLHEEILNMIEVEIHIPVPVEVVSEV